MRKIIDFLRFILISPELIVGLIVYITLNSFQFIPIFISKYLFADTTDIKWVLFGVTLPIIWYIYKFSEDILNPGKDENRKIQCEDF